MPEIKISFLIAAHNEEKIISKTLNNLLRLPHPNYEVVIGLDGCTDGTEEIVKKFVKKSAKFKYYKLNLRSGKPAVINSIIKKASGDIVIINDADWIFHIESKKSLERFLSVFDNPKVGGISEAYPLEWNKGLKKEKDLGYKMTAYSSYLWYKFQKKKFTKNFGEFLVIKNPALFMTNIFRKKLFKENTSLGDDFERTGDIMSVGYDVVISEDIRNPKMIPVYNKIPLRDLYNQKIRTARAREQVSAKKSGSKIDFKHYYVPATLYIFTRSWKMGPKVGFMMIFWIILTSIASLQLKLKSFDTKKGWTMRIRR